MDERSSDLSSALGKLLDDPEALKSAMKLASELKNSGALSGLFGEKNEKNEKNEYKENEEEYRREESAYTERKEEKAGEKPQRDDFRYENAEGSGTHRENRDADRRELLRALRPYMSRERQERIDTVLRILSLLETAEKLGLVR